MMKFFSTYPRGAVWLLLMVALVGHAQAPVQPAPDPAATTAATPSSAAATATAAKAADDTDDAEDTDEPPPPAEHHGRKHTRHHDEGSDIVSIGHDSELPAGQKADSVVAILGSSTSAGEAVDVVSIFGNTRITGPVKDNSVSIVGNTYIDAKVDGDVVAVVGNVELGPHAEIDGNVVAVLGMVKRDPSAIIHGGVDNVITGDLGDFSGMQAWIKHCLLYGRPLALVSGIGWAWTLALVFLGLYVCVALVFRNGLMACVQTLETQPGRTAVAALLTVLLTPF